MLTRPASSTGVASSAGRAVGGVAERGDRAAMHDALGAGLLRGAHHRDGALDIGAQHLGRVRAPRSGSRRRRARRSGSRRRRGPARRDRSGRRSRSRHPARPGCAGRWWGGRASAGWWPRAASTRATAEPTKPVAPVSSVVMGSACRVIGAGGVYGGRAVVGTGCPPLQERRRCPRSRIRYRQRCAIVLFSHDAVSGRAMLTCPRPVHRRSSPSATVSARSPYTRRSRRSSGR